MPATTVCGRLFWTTRLDFAATGLLCKRTGAALIVASIFTDGPGKWRVIFRRADNSSGDSVASLTAKAKRNDF